MCTRIKGLGMGFWFIAFDGFIVYAMGANEIGFGVAMLTTRFEFSPSSASIVSLLPYLIGAIS